MAAEEGADDVDEAQKARFWTTGHEEESDGTRSYLVVTMDKTNLDHVAFDESFLLGWSITPTEAMLFVQVLLTQDHPDYQPYDQRKEFGCYRLGILRFLDVRMVHGIRGDRLPRWSESTREFDDIDEINELEFADCKTLIVGDETNIEIEACAVRLQILPDMSADTFSEYTNQVTRPLT